MEGFVDFQRKVKHRVYIPDEDKVYKVSDDELMFFLNTKKIEELYIESAPKQWLYNLLDRNIAIYILRVKNQKTLRRKNNIKKTHENDAKLLYSIHHEHPEYFRRYVKRQLNNDPEIRRYILLLREKKRIKQKIDVNKKQGLPVKDLNSYLKNLQREVGRQLYHLKKKYNYILEKFNDIKGLSGNLLYFLTLIPEINSFKSLNSFLVYLGLRASYRRTWSREARDILIRMAMKVARYSDRKFNPRKPDWMFLRELVIIIYNRLRTGDG